MANYMKHRILIVEDDVVAAEFLSEVLGRAGYEVNCCFCAEEAVSLDLGSYNLLISDIRMPGGDGLYLLRHVQEKWPELPVIMVTAYGSMETAMEALRLGAFDYIGKPFSPEAIRSLVSKVLEIKKFQQQQRGSQTRNEESYRFVGSSAAMVELYKQLARVADTNVSVLIEGESGTGKELAARALHQLSSRRLKPFVVVHCGAIPENLLESELFGYEKGAFTGADHKHPGLLESCEEGTIFLDEISEMPPSLQGKLLRFMQNGEVRHLGGHQVRRVNVRVVAAANRNIDLETQKGTFRTDLLYRFVIRIAMPPLRKHREDLPQLVEAILKRLGHPSIRLSQETMELLIAYDWPGNVRELENVLQQAILLSTSMLILPENLPPRLHKPNELKESALSPLDEIQREQIIKTLKDTGWNQSRAARILGIDRKTLSSRINDYGLTRPSFP